MVLENLSQLEANVYEYVKRYLKKHNDFKLRAIIHYCHHHLHDKYSELEITKAIEQLMEKRYIIEGSTLSHDDILQNRVRKRLFHYIQINPGAYNRQIRRDLNLGSNEFNWHIGMLEKFGFIKRMQFNHSIGFFENKSYMGHEFDLFLLRNPKVHKILQYLKSHVETLSQIARNLEMHYSTVQKHLKILERRHLVLIEHNKHSILYKTNIELLYKLRKIVNGQVFVEFGEEYTPEIYSMALSKKK